jgi:hypothetical protein
LAEKLRVPTKMRSTARLSEVISSLMVILVGRERPTRRGLRMGSIEGDEAIKSQLTITLRILILVREFFCSGEGGDEWYL